MASDDKFNNDNDERARVIKKLERLIKKTYEVQELHSKQMKSSAETKDSDESSQ